MKTASGTFFRPVTSVSLVLCLLLTFAGRAMADPLCGDGVLDPGEICDDGNIVSGDGCPSDCVPTPCPGAGVPPQPTSPEIVPVCGNLVLEPPETCDDGNLISGDGCRSNCTTECCGDGVHDGLEGCDDGNTAGGDGCSASCNLEICGNGILDPGESCDDGNTSDTDNCTAACLVAVCGDGSVDQAAPGIEPCDDGNTSNADNCLNGCIAAACGDGFVDQAAPGIEPCDDGNASNNDNCTNLCNDAACGDGFVDQAIPGIESCDDGNAATGDGCRPDCTAEVCGDGIDDPQEQCDDGNAQGGDGCSAACKVELCGDGFVDVGESCDDGNAATGDGCRPDCTAELCGDGIDDPQEQCDDGNTQDYDGCSASCAIEGCGNGLVDPGEQCDDGNHQGGDGCRANCTAEFCADGILDTPEDCDDGNHQGGDGCSAACRFEACGNGFVDVGEGCDDGNTVAGDGCDAGCLSECTNGIVDPGEACDDGNAVNGDGCSAACKAEICGDGVVDAGEQCDDGNTAAQDGCSEQCGKELCDCCSPDPSSPGCNDYECQTMAEAYCPDWSWNDDCASLAQDWCACCYVQGGTCSNGIVEQGEQCDDGNTTNHDGCNALCQSELCGNGTLDPGEQCDDGNLQSGDGCSRYCFIEVTGCDCCEPDPGNTGCNDAACQDYLCSLDPFCCNISWDAICAGEAVDLCTCCPSGGGLAVCGNAIVEYNEQCDDGNTQGGDGCSSHCTTEGGRCLSQNIDSQTIDETYSKACGNSGLTTDNRWLRRFDLNEDHGISGDFCVSSVEYGVWAAGGNPDLTVSVYCIPNSVVTSGFVFQQDLILQDSASFEQADTVSQFVSRAVGGCCNGATEDLVVEIASADCLNGDDDCQVFRLGANPAGEIAPTYLAAPDCAHPEGQDTGSWGLPGLHALIQVCGGHCDCCDPDSGGAPGCDDAACQSTVCDADPFCCFVAWDTVCAGEAIDLCTCCRAPSICGNGTADPGEQCDDGNTIGGDGCGPTCHPDECAGDPGPCDDGNPCTDDTCVLGSCAHTDTTLPCNDGDACTVGDACGGGSCVGGTPANCDDGDGCTADACDPLDGCKHEVICCSEPSPRTKGFYMRMCDPSKPPQAAPPLSQADVDCVNDTCDFAGVASVAGLCAVLTSQVNTCALAEADFMALVLSVCRGLLCIGDPVELDCSSEVTVGGVLAEADALLCPASPSGAACFKAGCETHKINTGQATNVDTLLLLKVGVGIRLSWDEPLHDPATSVDVYHVWRRPVGGLWSLAAEVEANDPRAWTDVVAPAEDCEYEVTAFLQP